MNPEILIVSPQGYCGGVERAISKVLALRKAHPDERIILLGNIVHNRFISKALEDSHIETIDAKGKTRFELLDEIDDGIVVFTAHGVSPIVRDKAAAKGLKIEDASCPFVLNTQKLIQKKIDEGCHIFYVGKKGHPESEAAVYRNPNVTLIEIEDDIPEGIKKPLFVTNQTTLSFVKLQDLFKAIRQKYPEAEICDEICSATRVRQQAVYDLQNKQVDALLIVGDPSSNNTRQLAAAAKSIHIPIVERLETVMDLDLVKLKDCRKIAITSGASTPWLLTSQIIRALEDWEIPESLDTEGLLSMKRQKK